MTLTREAFATLYAQSWRQVFRHVLRRVGDVERAQDICSDVFELAWRKLSGGHPNHVGWLVRAADLEILGGFRESESERIALRDHAVVMTTDDADPHLRALDVAWSRLAEPHRAVLQLIIWDEMSAADAAVVLGCSEQAVWKRMSRARAALRALWPADDESQTEGVDYGIRSTSNR